MNSFRLILITLLLTIGLGELSAQRRVTPVTPREPGTVVIPEKDKPIDPTRLVETVDAEGNKVMVDTVTGREYVDSAALRNIPKMEYPLIYQATAGVNIWDPLMRAFGQKYGLGDIWGELNMHNRYFPYFALGVGACQDTPADKNFTFKVPVAPYFKLGASYNFFYNSNPDYKLQAGLRYGFSTFKWSVYDVTVDEGYWNDPSHFALNDLSHTAGWLELTFGIKVKIWRDFSAGWTIVYHSILHESKSPHGEPMYLPGYGKRSGAITGNFSIMYTIPINKKPVKEVEDI